MRKIKLTREEQWIEDHMEEFVPASKEMFDLVKRSLEARKKNAVLNLRINAGDLINLKAKAKKMGLKYQTFIAEVLHNVALA